MPSPRSSALAALFALSLTAAACGEDPPPAAQFETPTFAQIEEGEALALEGLFAYQEVFSQLVSKVAGSGYDQQTVETYYLIRLMAGESETSMTWRLEQACWSYASEVSNTATWMDPPYYAAIVHPDITVQLSALELGASFALPRQRFLYGVELANIDDPLPTDPDDPRVSDFDGDGQPGFTVHTEGYIKADIYTIQRTDWALDGVVYGPDLISGHVLGFPEQRLLEATSILVPLDTEIIPDEDPAHSFFNLVRVQEGFTCEQLVDQRSQLFGG